MSDFLGRLIQRSAAPGPARPPASSGIPVLLPRVPSLFEAPGEEVPAPETGPQRSVRAAGERGTGEGPGARTILPPASNGAGNPPPFEAAADPAGRTRAAAVPPEPARTEAGTLRVPAPQITRREVQPQDLLAAPFSAHRQMVEAPPARPLAEGTVLRPAPVSLLPAARNAAAAGDGQPAAGGSQGPAVRIHIGRIEVRAVRTPDPETPARRKSIPRPQLTLDEYARERRKAGP